MSDQFKAALHQTVNGLLSQLAPALIQALEQALLPHVQNAPAPQAFGGFGGTAQANPGLVGGGNPVAQNTPAAAANPFGAPAATQAPTVTPDMIQTLITPMVQNEQVKAALTAQMQAMGIQNLPDARPEQLAELYQRFQTVEQQAKSAGLLGGAAAGAPSII